MYHREEMVHLALVELPEEQRNHNVDSISTTHLQAALLEGEVGDIREVDGFRKMGPLAVHNNLAGLDSCGFAQDERSSCG